MIKGFKHKGLKALFESGDRKGVNPKHAQKLLDILDLLNAANNVKDLNFPGSILHPLKGRLKGLWSVRVSGNWRVVFRISSGDIFDIDYIDYH